ncbi:PREDICTED: cilia- and flagella-associated protein 57 [Nicrophorus vespilloides]|uniref:Cilia- and flagella-associated protein 57 n=1 Tax=Nicrophorus vespilloides TaxID=110193 RepID=A0ABM1N7D0_NICVS|nr:PREDICTED: cilia- and flagella-associated protein 57 [Nicrophorus vespilloides]
MATGVPALQPRLLLGLQTRVRGNAHYISDEEVVYPVGGVLCVHNINQKKQKFIKMPEKGANISIIAVSQNRKFVAVCEIGEKLSATIYDPWVFKKKKQIILPTDKEVQAKEIVAITFTYDSKNLVIVTGEPEWCMYVYKVEKGKLETTSRANNSNGTGTVVQIACNPNDPNLIVLVGASLFRNLACSEGNWRQYGFNKAENMTFTCAAWISQDRILCGTVDSKIIFFENADLKAIFHMNDLPMMVLKQAEEGGSAANMLEGEPSTVVGGGGEPLEISAMVSINRGFLFAFPNGNILFYEKESPNRYRKRNVFRIPDHSIERGEEEITEIFEEFANIDLTTVNTISINVSEDRFIATCNETQIYTMRIWGPDFSTAGELFMSELGFPLHHGPIGAAAVCAWKPIFMTTGMWDRSLRVWNYENESLELIKKYTEDIFGCSVHPTGLYAVVGFSDKLRYLKILIDDFVCVREYPIRACKICKFSTLGHLFAAVNGNVIQVYSSITFEHMFNLKGHNGLVTGLSWVHDDYKIASCGTEGAVYEWQISTTRRICETFIKSCQFADVAITADGKTNYCLGTDGRVREIVNSNVQGDITVTVNGLDAITLANSDGMIFATGNNGVLYSVQMPFNDSSTFNEYVVHASKCNALRITYDDKFVVSTSNSCVCLWKILNAEGKQVKLDKEFSPSTEVMIERCDLVEKMGLIKDLQVRMNELQTEHAYQMRQNEAAHNATIKEIHEGYCLAIEELKEKNENLEQEHNQEISNINLEINKMKSGHEMFVQKLEANYNEKLIVEYDKFMLLEEKMGRMRTRYDNQLEDLAEAKRTSEETITNNYEQQLREKEVHLEELVEKINQTVKEHDAITQQIEDDADREIFEIKSQFEKELREEQDLNVKLRSETQASKKKLQASQKNIDDLNHTVHMHEIEQHKLKTVIFGLEGSIGDLRKEIVERDSTIQDKEKRIAELKHKNQELEKFKFILEFKIDELKAQIEPRDRTIREQTEQINDMVNELENLQKIILSLELQLTELREKLKAADNEIKREIVKNRAAKASLKTIKTEIHNASGLSQEIPKLQKAVREMYHKYNADKDFAIAHAEDNEAKKEFLRQRDFLERTVKALKSQVSKAQVYSGENLRLLEQNSLLITETNNLRRNLKVERGSNKKMNALLGLSKQCSLAESQKKLDMAVATREEIRNEFSAKIDVNEKSIAILQDENTRLLEKITEDKNED